MTINYINLNDLFSNLTDTDEICIFEVDDLININYAQLEDFLNKNLKLICILYNKKNEHFLLLIKEHGIYSYIYKCDIMIGSIKAKDWYSTIIVTDDDEFTDLSDKGEYVTFQNYCCYIIFNIDILNLILQDLFDIIYNRIINYLFTVIDKLIDKNNVLKNDNETATKIIQESLDF